MALGDNYYCEVKELKEHIQASGGTSFARDDDVNLQIAIRAVSEWLDSWFDTTFYARTETRYYTPDCHDLLFLPDDLLAITTLKTDDDGNGTYETTWTSSDYWLEPRNAANGRKPKPYRQIRRNNNGDYSFPIVQYGVEIAGTWGYCTADNRPAEIKQFTLLMAHRLWKRKDAIFGIAGAPAQNVQVIQAKIEMDSDLMQLLKSIDRRGFYG